MWAILKFKNLLQVFPNIFVKLQKSFYPAKITVRGIMRIISVIIKESSGLKHLAISYDIPRIPSSIAFLTYWVPIITFITYILYYSEFN